MTFKVPKRTFWIIAAAAFAFLVSFEQPFGYSPDYLQYETFFYDVKNYFEYAYEANRFEPGFFFSSFLLGKLVDSELAIYGILAAISASIKLSYAFKFSEKNMYLWVLVFFAFKYFPLHELTQLRASLAAAFLSVSFYFLTVDSKKTAGFFCVIAVLFHYSAIMILPFLFLPRLELKKTIGLAAIIFLLLYFISEYLIDIAGVSFSVFELYEKSGFSQKELNIFSPVFFPEFFMIFVSLVMWQRLTDVMRQVVMIEIMGFAVFYAFSSYGVVAVRGRELFSIFWIFFVAQIPRRLTYLKIAIVIFVFSSISLSIYQYFISDFFVPRF